jgi:hypothetical protein
MPHAGFMEDLGDMIRSFDVKSQQSHVVAPFSTPYACAAPLTYLVAIVWPSLDTYELACQP